MAEWKKVLVSGSDISVAAITASNIPGGDSGDQVLVLDTGDNSIKRVDQSVIQGSTEAEFQISGSTGNNLFDATSDKLVFDGTNNASTTVTTAGAGNDITIVTVSLPPNTVSGSQQVNIANTIGYTSFSSSFAASITTNETNIATNTADITSIQDDIIELVASSSELTQASSSIATFITTADSDIDGIEGSITALELFTSSVVTNNDTGSFLISSSVIGTDNQIKVTANNITPGQSGIKIGLTNDVTIGGRLEAGKLVIQGNEVTDVGAAIVDGSTIQGNNINNIHRFTGSLQVTGALDIKGTNLAISDLSEMSDASFTHILVRRYADGEVLRAGESLRSEISGAFDAVSASLAEDLSNIDTTATTTNSTDIIALQLISASLLASQSQGIRFETSADNGGSSALGETASFAASGTGLSIDIANDGVNTTTVTYTVDPEAIADSVNAFTSSAQLQAVLDDIYVELADAPISGAEQLQTLGFITASDFDDILNPAPGLISESLNGEDGTQGEIRLNGNAVSISNLGTTGNPTFNNLTVSNNLTVKGTTTSIKTDNLNIEDQFILINSGASGTPGSNGEQDGGIIVDSGNGKGALLMYSENRKSWGFKGTTDPANGVLYNAESDGNGQILPEVQIATVGHSTGLGAGVAPTSEPTYGFDIYKKGQMHINNDDSTIWIYV